MGVTRGGLLRHDALKEEKEGWHCLGKREGRELGVAERMGASSNSKFGWQSTRVIRRRSQSKLGR